MREPAVTAGNRSLQAEFQQRQPFINESLELSRLNTQIIRGLATLSARSRDEAIRQLLLWVATQTWGLYGARTELRTAQLQQEQALQQSRQTRAQLQSIVEGAESILETALLNGGAHGQLHVLARAAPRPIL